MRIISVNIGSTREILVRGKRIPTGIFKEPVQGPLWVDIQGLRGDVRVEARKLGESDHAVHAYPFEHYTHWRDYLGREELPLGLFGENLTVAGLPETEVRVGDVFRFGTALLQVTQPRIPCRKLDARVGEGFKRAFLESRRVGYYLRVVTPGPVAAGDPIELVDRDFNSPTLDDFVRLSQYDYWDAVGLEYLLHGKDLSDRWRDILRDKLARALGSERWFGLRELEIFQRREESETAASFYLRCARNRPLPPFRAGQDLTLAIRPDPDGPVHRRAASLSSDPGETSSFYRITVAFGGSQAADRDPESAFLRGLKPGDTIRATEPQGWFTLDVSPATSCGRVFFVHEGIGIASILPMLHIWFRNHSRMAATLLHKRPTAGFGLLRSEAEAIRSRGANLTIRESERFELREPDLADGPIVFAAGPDSLLTEVQNECISKGLDHTRIRVKRVLR